MEQSQDAETHLQFWVSRGRRECPDDPRTASLQAGKDRKDKIKMCPSLDKCASMSSEAENRILRTRNSEQCRAIMICLVSVFGEANILNS